VLTATRTWDSDLAGTEETDTREAGIGRGFVNLGTSYREQPWQRLQCFRANPAFCDARDQCSVRGWTNSTERELDARAAGAAVLMPRPGVGVGCGGLRRGARWVQVVQGASRTESRVICIRFRLYISDCIPTDASGPKGPERTRQTSRSEAPKMQG
jgi:hypothetical protein